MCTCQCHPTPVTASLANGRGVGGGGAECHARTRTEVDSEFASSVPGCVRWLAVRRGSPAVRGCAVRVFPRPRPRVSTQYTVVVAAAAEEEASLSRGPRATTAICRLVAFFGRRPSSTWARAAGGEGGSRARARVGGHGTRWAAARGAFRCEAVSEHEGGSVPAEDAAASSPRSGAPSGDAMARRLRAQAGGPGSDPHGAQRVRGVHVRLS
ncbi:hypothetical protein BC628DRAFT_575750 [Trametes gibbosa]|nr:hypothetical protein BC628DRAFT_575750 [Trametes gibbosa]